MAATGLLSGSLCGTTRLTLVQWYNTQGKGVPEVHNVRNITDGGDHRIRAVVPLTIHCIPDVCSVVPDLERRANMGNDSEQIIELSVGRNRRTDTVRVQALKWALYRNDLFLLSSVELTGHIKMQDEWESRNVRFPLASVLPETGSVVIRVPVVHDKTNVIRNATASISGTLHS